MTTAFNTDAYEYPTNFNEIKAKLDRLKVAIKNLEANLVTPANPVTPDDIAIHLDNELVVDYAKELNPSQLLACTSITGKNLVIAGAGSGKTKTLTYRTSYLLEQGVNPKSILLLTFTRKASNEIKSRAKKLLHEKFKLSDNEGMANNNGSDKSVKDNAIDNPINTSDITSGTFHSFCNLLLRRYSGMLGINAKFTILDTADAEDAIDLVLKEQDYARDKTIKFPKKKTLQTIISTCRSRYLTVDELLEKNYPDFTDHAQVIEQLAKDYHHYKRSNDLYDFDDIISETVKHLKKNSQFRYALQQQFQHIMVDEYQDTNIPQKRLIDLICDSEQVSLMVVGDDNQSIYAFRGANYENILLFGDTYPHARLIKLEQNYRSTPAVLDYVNALSSEITLGYQKQLFSEAKVDGIKPIFTRCTDESAEAKFIADSIIELRDTYNYNDFAVLGRTSFQSNYVQVEFMNRNIPFIVVGGIKFIERRHIKDVLAFFKILYNPNDAISWHRILMLFQGVGRVTATKLTNAIKQAQQTVDNTLGNETSTTNDAFAPLLKPTFLKKNEQLKDLHTMLGKCADTTGNGKSLSVSDMLAHILEFYTPILQIIEENWRERSEDFKVLAKLAVEYGSVERFLENLALDPPNDSVAVFKDDQEKQKDAVTISTIHSAKGLEWAVVFINTLVDGMMPHHRSSADFEELEEERKLFYVACSRAKHQLYLSAPHYMSSYSGYFDKVSRFIAEVPAETIDITETETQIEDDLEDWW